ncbi:MAG: hypothetical protein WDA27_08685 [Actinomycetota bacterium]
MIGTETLSTRRNAALVWSALLAVGAVFLGRQIVVGGPMLRVTVAIVVMVVLAIPALERPRSAVLGLFILLPLMGTLRHMFVSATGAAALDPLLLVTSSVAVTVFVSLMLKREMDFTGTTLAKIVFLLLVVGLIQVFNPGQGNLLVGLTGVMINLIPISFFFVARSIADLEFTHKVVRIVLVMGTLAAAYGLVQVFVGFRGFEKTWLGSQGYTAATVGSTTRPFSFFNNSAEYAAYAHYAFVVALAMLMFAPKARRLLLAAVVGVIAYAGFLTGSRGFTVKIALAVVVLIAARVRNRVLATGVAMILVTLAVGWSATTSSDSTIQEKESGAAQLIEQQLRALRDPFDRSKSTLPIHFESGTAGISYAISHQPIGLGTGSATRGAAKFGGRSAGTELDIGDAFLSLGIPGGILYVLAIVVAVVQASRVRRALPGPVWIAIWAMAVTSIGAWLIGGQYAITPLIWFLIGASDGAYKRLRDRGLMDGTLPA